MTDRKHKSRNVTAQSLWQGPQKEPAESSLICAAVTQADTCSSSCSSSIFCGKYLDTSSSACCNKATQFTLISRTCATAGETSFWTWVTSLVSFWQKSSTWNKEATALSYLYSDTVHTAAGWSPTCSPHVTPAAPLPVKTSADTGSPVSITRTNRVTAGEAGLACCYITLCASGLTCFFDSRRISKAAMSSLERKSCLIKFRKTFRFGEGKRNMLSVCVIQCRARHGQIPTVTQHKKRKWKCILDISVLSNSNRERTCCIVGCVVFFKERSIFIKYNKALWPGHSVRVKKHPQKWVSVWNNYFIVNKTRSNNENTK